ncbi:MAG: hypothetical protein HYU53_04335 [Acidobacteria bacterium]|nr:hypothetical protein [Acidobacteriota bacterium]
MRRRRARAASAVEWPLALRQIILAAERECTGGHAEALRELLALALVKVPSRGIFDPTCRGEDELFTAIESVAHAYLDLRPARKAWREALRTAATDINARDRVEQAALQLQCVSDTAYFYAGLAFGLAAVSLFRTR